ncbi:MAG: hypothetical protein ACXQTI_07665 [Candidatus Nezhaarchaeales archaeon]
MSVGCPVEELVREGFRRVLGDVSFKVLEYHFDKLLGMDPAEALLRDPKAFYETLNRFFRAGTDILLETILKIIFRDTYRVNINVKDVLSAIKLGEVNKVYNLLSGSEKLVKL